MAFNQSEDNLDLDNPPGSNIEPISQDRGGSEDLVTTPDKMLPSGSHAPETMGDYESITGVSGCQGQAGTG